MAAHRPSDIRVMSVRPQTCEILHSGAIFPQGFSAGIKGGESIRRLLIG